MAGGLEVLTCGLEVVRCATVLPRIAVKSREQDIGDARVPVSRQGARSSVVISVQVGLDRRRATLEYDTFGPGEIDCHRRGREGLHFDLSFRDPITASDDDRVGSLAQPQSCDTGACVAK